MDGRMDGQTDRDSNRCIAMDRHTVIVTPLRPYTAVTIKNKDMAPKKNRVTNDAPSGKVNLKNISWKVRFVNKQTKLC